MKRCGTKIPSFQASILKWPQSWIGMKYSHTFQWRVHSMDRGSLQHMQQATRVIKENSQELSKSEGVFSNAQFQVRLRFVCNYNWSSEPLLQDRQLAKNIFILAKKFRRESSLQSQRTYSCRQLSLVGSSESSVTSSTDDKWSSHGRNWRLWMW
jgi:hypothetical protein